MIELLTEEAEDMVDETGLHLTVHADWWVVGERVHSMLLSVSGVSPTNSSLSIKIRRWCQLNITQLNEQTRKGFGFRQWTVHGNHF